MWTSWSTRRRTSPCAVAAEHPRRRLARRAARLGRRHLRPTADPHDRMGAGRCSSDCGSAATRRCSTPAAARARSPRRSANDCPRGHVDRAGRIALDGRRARVERLGADRMTYLTHDLLDPIPIDPVDAIFSTATLPLDRRPRPALRESRRGAAGRRGQLAAQCGGWGNLERVNAAAERAAGDRPDGDEAVSRPRRRPGPGSRPKASSTSRRWLTEAPIELPAGELEPYLRTVILSGEVARRSPEDADQLVHAVATELGEPSIDYVRLNIVARMG